jgi:hypothetical protein
VLQIGGLAVAASDASAALETIGLPGPAETVDDALFGSRLMLSPGAASPTLEEAAAALADAGFGPALAPASIASAPVPERALRSA